MKWLDPLGQIGGRNVRAPQIKLSLASVECPMAEEYDPQGSRSFFRLVTHRPLQHRAIGQLRHRRGVRTNDNAPGLRLPRRGLPRRDTLDDVLGELSIAPDPRDDYNGGPFDRVLESRIPRA